MSPAETRLCSLLLLEIDLSHAYLTVLLKHQFERTGALRLTTLNYYKNKPYTINSSFFVAARGNRVVPFSSSRYRSLARCRSNFAM